MIEGLVIIGIFLCLLFLGTIASKVLPDSFFTILTGIDIYILPEGDDCDE